MPSRPVLRMGDTPFVVSQHVLSNGARMVEIGGGRIFSQRPPAAKQHPCAPATPLPTRGVGLGHVAHQVVGNSVGFPTVHHTCVYSWSSEQGSFEQEKVQVRAGKRPNSSRKKAGQNRPAFFPRPRGATIVYDTSLERSRDFQHDGSVYITKRHH